MVAGASDVQVTSVIRMQGANRKKGYTKELKGLLS